MTPPKSVQKVQDDTDREKFTMILTEKMSIYFHILEGI